MPTLPTSRLCDLDTVDGRRRLMRDHIDTIDADHIYMGSYLVLDAQFVPELPSHGYRAVSLSLSELVHALPSRAPERMVDWVADCSTAACFLGHTVIAMHQYGYGVAWLKGRDWIAVDVAEWLGVPTDAFHSQWWHWPSVMRTHYEAAFVRQGHAKPAAGATHDRGIVAYAERCAIIGYLDHLIAGGEA